MVLRMKNSYFGGSLKNTTFREVVSQKTNIDDGNA